VLALYLSLLFVLLDSPLSRRLTSGALVPELNGQFDKLTDHTIGESRSLSQPKGCFTLALRHPQIWSLSFTASSTSSLTILKENPGPLSLPKGCFTLAFINFAYAEFHSFFSIFALKPTPLRWVGLFLLAYFIDI